MHNFVNLRDFVLFFLPFSAVHWKHCNKQLLTTEHTEIVSVVPEWTEKSNDFSML